MKYYATKGQIDQAEYAKSIGGRILEHFENYFNISYPLPKAGWCFQWSMVWFHNITIQKLFFFQQNSRHDCCTRLRCWCNGKLGSDHIPWNSNVIQRRPVIGVQQRKNCSRHCSWASAHGMTAITLLEKICAEKIGIQIRRAQTSRFIDFFCF